MFYSVPGVILFCCLGCRSDACTWRAQWGRLSASFRTFSLYLVEFRMKEMYARDAIPLNSCDRRIFLSYLFILVPCHMTVVYLYYFGVLFGDLSHMTLHICFAYRSEFFSLLNIFSIFFPPITWDRMRVILENAQKKKFFFRYSEIFGRDCYASL